MTLLVFGKTGQVARELQTHKPIISLGRKDANLSDPDACAAAIKEYMPSAVINVAAYTAVDGAEEDEEYATIVNGFAPAIMARACTNFDIPFVHISTDYVFDGSGAAAWKPGDPTTPIGAYGRSKLMGEEKVRSTGGRYAIVRTSWVFSAHGQNFVKTMLNLGIERDQLNIVADQIGGPTPARSIANACLIIAGQLSADPTKSGTYHFAGDPEVSWADFAREIFRQAKLKCEINDITSTEYPTLAQRPKNSRLDCKATKTAFGILRPDWRLGLSEVLDEILDKEEEK